MKNCLQIGFVLAVALATQAFAGQYYNNAYSRGYSQYAGDPNDYECVPVNQALVSVMHRSARLKKRKAGSPSDVKYTPTSFAVGYVHTVEKLQIGAAFNFEGGNRKVKYEDGSNYKVRTNIPGISAFATYRPFVDSTYVSGSMFLGFANYKAKDAWTAAAGSINGTDKEHRNVFSMSVEAGRTWNLGSGFLFTPHIGIDYAYAPSERYRYNGSDTDIDSQSFWEIPIGVTVRKTFGCGAWLLTPRVDLTLVPTVGNIDPKNAHPGFSYRVADKWKVVGASGSNFGARVSFGVDARLGERLSLGVDYTYEGRSKYNDHRISATFGLAF